MTSRNHTTGFWNQHLALDEVILASFWQSPIGMCVARIDGHLIEVNEAFARYVNYSREELMAGDFRRITHPDDIDTNNRKLRRLLDGKCDSYQMEKRYQTKDGRTVHGLLSCAPIRDSDGEILAILGQVQDITRRVEVEESLKQWQAVFEGGGWGRAVVRPERSDSTPLEPTMSEAFIETESHAEDRVRILAKTDLLKAPLEQFDRLSCMACRLLSVPVALISLVDDDRQFFCGAKGLPEPWSSHRETPLTHSFCQHVVRMKDPLVIEDAAVNRLVADNLAIPDLGVRAYLGLPILSPDGVVVGSFCAIDTKPRQWTQDDLEVLEGLAGIVSTEVAVRLHLNTMADQKEELAASEERYRLAVDGAKDGVWDWDVVNDTCRYSSGFAGLVGANADDFTGDKEWWHDRVHPEDEEHVFAAIQNHFESRDPYHVKYRLRTDSGEYRWFEARGRAVWNDAGEPIRMVGSVADISDRVQAETERDRCFALSIDLMCVTDLDGTIRRVNPAFTEMLGYEDFEVVNDSILSLIHDDDIEAAQTMLAGLRAGADCVGFETRCRRRDGRYRWLAWNIPAPSDSMMPVYAVARDVTSHREHQQSLEEARSAAELASKAKDQFLACVSHEIRTPMNGILGMTDLLMTTAVTDDQQDYVKTIETSAECLLTLINDLLDFSKVQAGKFELEISDFDPQTTVAKTVDLLRPTAAAKGLDLAYQFDRVRDCRVEGDPHRLRQVLINLIGNAIKFTPNGSVNVEVIERQVSAESVELRIAVVDTGIGIAEEDQARIFDAFTQAEQTNAREYGGTGLGLAIAASLVKTMGSQLHVESTPGIGSAFVFDLELPIHRATESEPQDTAPLSGGGTPLEAIQRAEASNARSGSKQIIGSLRILVAEDNPINQRYMREVLTKVGHQVEVAAGGEEAVEQCLAKPFDLILMDVQMPGMTGIEATEKLRELGVDIPIIVVSANAMATQREFGLSCGATDYLTKPLRIDELYAALEEYGRSRDTKQLAAENTGHPLPPQFDEQLRRIEKMIDGLQGDRDVYKELASDVVAQFPASLEELRLNLLDEAMDEARLVAHSMHGAFRVLGFDNAADVAMAIEERALTQDSFGAQELLPDLETAFAGAERLLEIADLKV